MQVAIQLGSSGAGGLLALGVGLRLYKRSRIRGVAGGCVVRGRLPRQHDTVTARLGRAAEGPSVGPPACAGLQKNSSSEMGFLSRHLITSSCKHNQNK